MTRCTLWTYTAVAEAIEAHLPANSAKTISNVRVRAGCGSDLNIASGNSSSDKDADKLSISFQTKARLSHVKEGADGR